MQFQVICHELRYNKASCRFPDISAEFSQYESVDNIAIEPCSKAMAINNDGDDSSRTDWVWCYDFALNDTSLTPSAQARSTFFYYALPTIANVTAVSKRRFVINGERLDLWSLTYRCSEMVGISRSPPPYAVRIGAEPCSIEQFNASSMQILCDVSELSSRDSVSVC